MSDSARALRITLVDLFGLFVPGCVLVFALLASPPVLASLRDYVELWYAAPGVLKEVLGVGYVAATVAAVVLGFLNRMIAMRLATVVTGAGRLRGLEPQLKRLDLLLDDVLVDPAAWPDIERASRTLGQHAPRFHFLKRHLRATRPDLWEDAERIEADVRMVGGLIVPVLALLVDAGWYSAVTAEIGPKVVALLLVAVLWCLLHWYPIRRAREVVNVYFLVLVGRAKATPPDVTCSPTAGGRVVGATDPPA